MYILDTNVVSELRKAKKTHPNVKKWAGALPSASLYISVISVLELEIGILLLGRGELGLDVPFQHGHQFPRHRDRVPLALLGGVHDLLAEGVSKARSFVPGWTATCYPHSPAVSLRLTPPSPSDAQRFTCRTLAPIVMP